MARRNSTGKKDRIVVDPKVLVGKPVIRGTRISVEFVVDLLARGRSVDDVVEQYDVSRADVLACLAYAAELLKSEKVFVVPA